MAVLHLIIYRDHLDTNVWVNRITPSRLILITQVLHSANWATSFSQRSHIIQPTKLTLPPNEVESSAQRNRIFCPAQSYLEPNAVISIGSMKRINLLNDVHDFIYLLKLAGVPIPYHIYWHWCEYRKSINDDVIDWYNDMLIEAISIWEGGRVIPPTMQEKLRHDVAVATSRRNNNYIPTQWQLRRDAVSGASCPLSSKALLKFERAFFGIKSKPHFHFWW